MERTKTRKFIAEQIRSQYVKTSNPKNSFDSLVKLQSLDRRVKNVPKIWCIILGIISCITFVCCISVAMIILLNGHLFGIIPDNMTTEVMIACFVISGCEILLMAINYPIYKIWYNRRHEYYSNEIILLSDKILGEVDFIVNYEADNEPSSAEIVILKNKEAEEEKKYIIEETISDEPENSPEALNDIPVN